jgi:hypothetical protein
MSLGIINAALDDLERLKDKLMSLRALAEKEESTGADQPAIKDKKGHLTEFGVTKLREWLDAGHGPSDIARALDVSPSAVIYQRNIYLAER